MSSAPRCNASACASASAASNDVADDDAGGCEAAIARDDDVGAPGSGRFSEAKVLRPITTGLFIVIALRRCMSLFSRHGIALSAPITPLSATAAISTISVMTRPLQATRAPVP